MNAIPVGQLKANFSNILERVKKGEQIVVSFGKKKEKVAVIVPFKQAKTRQPRKLGLLKGKANCILKENFKMKDEELISL